MPIRVLSEATSHVLTSTQALNNSVSVVKELVDNALDARASSISIEIAANTLDRIIVKDDGSGIGVEDRQLLCKRGCTSKIANLDDLARLGGTFLGFRGTALASIAELSREVTIVTRVEGEQPATSLTFGPSGKLSSSASASHNAGTTVRIEGFLDSIPVRRQVVLKNPSKVLDEIKKLLQGYALARPAVKLSLKVLKAKDNRSNWSFASSRGHDDLSTAAVQIVGKAVVACCEVSSQSSAGGGEDGIKVEALLFNVKDHDISKTGNIGQYFSIDGRPVNHEKDIAKDIVKRYKAYLQYACAQDATIPSKPFLVMHIHCPVSSYDVNVEPAKDVVLFHEPQQVLALVEQLFVAVYGDLREEEVKPKSGSTASTRSNHSLSFDVLLARRKPGNSNDDSRDSYRQRSEEKQSNTISTASIGSKAQSLVEQFAEAMQDAPTTSQRTPTKIQGHNHHKSSHDMKQFHTMAGFYSDDGGSDHISNEPIGGAEEEENYSPGDITINNPFTRAKAYSIRRPEQSPRYINTAELLEAVDQPTHQPRQPSSPTAGTPTTSTRVSMNQVYHPLTPGTSPAPYQNPGPPYRRRNKQSHERYSEDDEDIDQSGLSTRGNERQGSFMRNWVKSTVPSGSPMSSSRSNNTSSSPSTLTIQPGFISANMQTQSTTMNTPFRSPLKTPRAIGFAHAHESEGAVPYTPQLGSSERSVPSVTNQEDNDDLLHILEFEQRKKVLNQQLKHSQAVLNPGDLARIQHGSLVAANATPTRTEQPGMNSAGKTSLSQSITLTAEITDDLNSNVATPQTTLKATSNPHRNRFLAATRNLDTPRQPNNDNGRSLTLESSTLPSSLGHTTDKATSLAPSDPRAILHSTRQSHTTTATALTSLKPNARRAKSSRLPFETIPATIKKHDVLAHPPTSFPSIEHLSASVQTLVHVDEYIRKGKVEVVTWSPAGRDVQRWQSELEELVRRSHRARMYIGDTGADEGYEEVMVPDGVVDLARAIRAQLDQV